MKKMLWALPVLLLTAQIATAQDWTWADDMPEMPFWVDEIPGAAISSYSVKANPVGADILVGSDSEDSYATSNFRVDSLPVSTAVQAAIDLKANASDVYTKAEADAADDTGTDDQTITAFSLSGNILSITIESGNTITVDLSSITGVGTDDQTVTDLSLSGTTLSITLENGNTATVDLASLSGDGGALPTGNTEGDLLVATAVDGVGGWQTPTPVEGRNGVKTVESGGAIYIETDSFEQGSAPTCASGNGLYLLTGGGSYFKTTGYVHNISAGTNTACTDTTPPTVSSVTVNGSRVIINWSEAVSGGSGYADSLFNLDMSTTGADIALSNLLGDGTTTWEYTAELAAVNGETVDLDFAGATDAIEDAAGNDAVAFANQAVTNNTPAGGGSAVSDDFSGDLSAWAQDSGSFTISTGKLVAPTGAGHMRYDTEMSSATQYAKITLDDITGTNNGFMFRASGSTGYWYRVSYNQSTSNLIWQIYNGSSFASTTQQYTISALSAGDEIAATVQGSGAGTIISVWVNPTNNTPTDANNWDSGSDPAAAVLTNDPLYAADTGLYVGVSSYHASSTSNMDDFYGGSL